MHRQYRVCTQRHPAGTGAVHEQYGRYISSTTAPSRYRGVYRYRCRVADVPDAAGDFPMGPAALAWSLGLMHTHGGQCAHVDSHILATSIGGQFGIASLVSVMLA
jgi:hypothetical protein